MYFTIEYFFTVTKNGKKVKVQNSFLVGN